MTDLSIALLVGRQEGASRL